MEALIKYYMDRFTPEELVEHIDIPMRDLTDCLYYWLSENREKFREDFELIYQEDFEALNDRD